MQQESSYKKFNKTGNETINQLKTKHAVVTPEGERKAVGKGKRKDNDVFFLKFGVLCNVSLHTLHISYIFCLSTEFLI